MRYEGTTKLLQGFATRLKTRVGILTRFETFADKWEAVFEKEVHITDIGISAAINRIQKIAQANSAIYVIVFRDDSYRGRHKKQTLFPCAVRTCYLKKIFDQKVRDFYLNIYIADPQLRWVATICHEGDIHLAGSSKFVKDETELLQNFTN